jgi:hypothetical protein
MTLKKLFAALPTALLIVSNGAASAGQTIPEVGAFVCVTDKWDEKELEKGHKLATAVQRCVLIPDDPAAPKVTEECTAKYEYMPDKSWKGTGTCTDTYQNGAKKTYNLEEGSHLKAYKWTNTGGSGKYEGAKGGGTYMYDNLTDTLSGGRYKGTLELP